MTLLTHREAASFILGYVCALGKSFKDDPRHDELAQALRIIAKLYAKDLVPDVKTYPGPSDEDLKSLEDLARHLWQSMLIPRT